MSRNHGPDGAWAVMQVGYGLRSYDDANAALLLSLRPPLGPFSRAVLRPQDTWLATLAVNVKPELLAAVADIVDRHVGVAGISPTLELPNGSTVRLFRMIGPVPLNRLRPTLHCGRIVCESQLPVSSSWVPARGATAAH